MAKSSGQGFLPLESPHPDSPHGGNAPPVLAAGSKAVALEYYQYGLVPLRLGRLDPVTGEVNPKAAVKTAWSSLVHPKHAQPGEEGYSLDALLRDMSGTTTQYPLGDFPLGIVLGSGSGRLFALDVESADAYHWLLERLIDHEDVRGTDIAELIARTWIARTPAGGAHIILKCDFPVPAKIREGVPYSLVPDGQGKMRRKAIVEGLGQGQQVAVPLTLEVPDQARQASLAGTRYWELAPCPAIPEPALITKDQLDFLWKTCGELNEVIEEPPVKKNTLDVYQDQISIFDRVNRDTAFQQRAKDRLLSAGWTVSKEVGDGARLNRPGKTSGHGGSWGICRRKSDNVPLFYSFTSSSSMPQNQAMTPWDLIQFLDYGNDQSAMLDGMRVEYDHPGRAVSSDPVDEDDPSDHHPKMVPFPIEIFPRAIADYVTATAEAMQVDPAFVAIPALAACAAAVGNSRVLRINACWVERACLWTAIIADSGSRKTPAFKSALAPLWAVNQEQMGVNDVAIRDWRTACEQCKKGEKHPPKPIESRTVIQDCTVERLGALLSENPKGLLMAENELKGWFDGFTRYSPGSAASYWLNFFDGATTVVDRIGRPSIGLNHPLVSVTGTSQPAVMGKLLDADAWSSGLAPRLIIAMPPVDFVLYRSPPKVIAGQAEYEDILTFCATNLDGVGLELNFDTAAYEMWETDLNTRKRHAFYNTSGSRRAHLSKIEAIPARWSLIHHVLTGAATKSPSWNNPIPIASIEAGCTLARWVEGETARVMGLLSTAGQESSDDQWFRALQAWPNGVTAAELSRYHHGKLPNSTAAEILLKRLVSMRKAGKIDKKGKNGQTVTRYFLA